MVNKQPSLLAFDTNLLIYAAVKNYISTLITSSNLPTESLSIQLQDAAQTLTIKIRSSDRYAVLKLKTEILDIQEHLQHLLAEKKLLHNKEVLCKIHLA